MIGAEQLRCTKPGAYLVNTSRGKLVDPAVLLRALDGGEITGVAINVLETEPPEAGELLVTDEQILVTCTLPGTRGVHSDVRWSSIGAIMRSGSVGWPTGTRAEGGLLLCRQKRTR